RLGSGSIISRWKVETPLVPANRTAPNPVEHFAGTEILNTARSSAERMCSVLASKLVHRFVAAPRLLPKKVISVVFPGATALGSRYLMLGESARPVTRAKRSVAKANCAMRPMVGRDAACV